ncbi:unnamed protein product [Rotaria sp. Silwood2]|nr:unnamed protein product [Rotaria sp. Silwood2]CAF4096554.1 unnamed protein product [Rotaria sp. Silwood2]
MYKVADTNGYTWNFNIYTGKQNSTTSLGYSETVTMELSEDLFGCYRTVVADNFFTSIALAKRLLGNDTYLIGTLRTLTKLNETRHRLDLCQNPLIKSIYWNEIYCDAHLKRYQVQSSTSTLSSLLSISVAKEFKTMETKIQSLKIIDQQTAQLNSNYIQLNSQFCRTIVDFLLAQPLAYHNYEQDEKIPQAKHKQLEMYLYGLENNNNQIQQAD